MLLLKTGKIYKMAEMTIQKEETGNDLFQYFSGVNEEIFEKLPKPDKRPYIIIGVLGFGITLLVSVLIFLIMGQFNIRIAIKFGVSITVLVLISRLQRIIIARLIHQFNAIGNLIFWGYASVITLLFIISLSTGLLTANSSYTEYNSIENTMTESVPAVAVDSAKVETIYLSDSTSKTIK